MTLSGDPKPAKDASSERSGSSAASPTASPPSGSAEARGNGGPPPAHDARLVHELRKTIKRMRALARLLRYELGEEAFDSTNDSLRGAGQRLAGERDAEVRLATLERLRARHPKALARVGVERLRTQLEHERTQAGASVGEPDRVERAYSRTSGPASEEELLGDIADMRQVLSNWRGLDPDFEAIAPGLRHIYEDGRHRYELLGRRHVGHVKLHDWRKRVKALYYALDMLGDSKEGHMRATAKRAERLGDILGEEHDLWMLAAYANEHSDLFGNDGSSRKKLLKTIRRRRKRLRKLALELGAHVYEQDSKDFISSMHTR